MYVHVLLLYVHVCVKGGIITISTLYIYDCVNVTNIRLIKRMYMCYYCTCKGGGIIIILRLRLCNIHLIKRMYMCIRAQKDVL